MPNWLAGERKTFSRLVIEGGDEIGVGVMSWEKWIATQGEAFKRGHHEHGTLNAVKGAYKAGFKDGKETGYDEGEKEGQLSERMYCGGVSGDGGGGGGGGAYFSGTRHMRSRQPYLPVCACHCRESVASSSASSASLSQSLCASLVDQRDIGRRITRRILNFTLSSVGTCSRDGSINGIVVYLRLLPRPTQGPTFHCMHEEQRVLL